MQSDEWSVEADRQTSEVFEDFGSLLVGEVCLLSRQVDRERFRCG